MLNIRLGDVNFDENGARVRVTGKTGPRVVRLVTAAPLLSSWVEQHPVGRARDPEAPLWISLATNYQAQERVLEYHSAVKIVKNAASRAGVKKRIYPHLFRHSSAALGGGRGFHCLHDQYCCSSYNKLDDPVHVPVVG